jgi:hypothetical protein
VMKNGTRTLKHKRHKLIWNIWDKEHLPTQWNEGVTWPIYKTGDRLKCYRPITLLNIAHKIFAILLNKILSDTVLKIGRMPNWISPQII